MKFRALIVPLLALALAFVTAATAEATTAAAAAPQARHLANLWLPPLGEQLRVTERFSLPNGPYQAGHRGVDLHGRAGQTVHAPTNATVSFVGVVVDRPVVSLRVDPQTVVSFEPVTSELHVGDTVLRGSSLGEISTGGHCTRGCLHLGVRVNGEYINPLRYLRPRPVLLPW